MSGIAVTPGAFAAAPHVRAARDVRRCMATLAVALAPPVLGALWVTGAAANAALARGAPAAGGWRAELLSAVGAGSDPGDPIACLMHGLLWLAPVFVAAGVTTALWQRAFAARRGTPPAPGALPTAVLFALLLPPAVPLWQVVLGVSFGVVVAQELFGGLGKNFLHPVLVGVAFLGLAYPDAVRGAAAWAPVSGAEAPTALALAASGGREALRGAGVAWTDVALGRGPVALGEVPLVATALGAALLLGARLVSWRVVAGGLAGLAVTATLLAWSGWTVRPLAALPWYWHLALGGSGFGLAFLATDPVTAAVTNAGRWVYGALVGAMIVLVRVGNPAQPDATVTAILLGNMLAPLVDHAVVRANARRRARRG